MFILKIFVIMSILALVLCRDLTETHTKLYGDCLVLVEQNIRDATLPSNISFTHAEELCDEFAAYAVKWIIQ